MILKKIKNFLVDIFLLTYKKVLNHEKNGEKKFERIRTGNACFK